jgi:hypothetical protein
MKPLRKLLLGFGLAAAALIVTTGLWISDDYYTAVLDSHLDHPRMLPHDLAWSFPHVFLFIAFITIAALWRVIQLSPPPFTARLYSLIAAGISIVAIAFQPIYWLLEKQVPSLESPPAAVFVWRAIWLTICGLLFAVSFALCYRRLTSQSASPPTKL